MPSRRKRKRKRKRYLDQQSLSSSDSHVKSLPAKERHDTRRTSANRLAANAGLAFASIGGWLVVTNEGHHWRVVFPRNKVAEWWPSSAKLVIDKNWTQGIHAHRWQDVFNYLRKEQLQ